MTFLSYLINVKKISVKKCNSAQYYFNLMSTSLRGYIELYKSIRIGKPTIYHGVGNEYKIKIGF